jgi:hypothetical protein
MMHTKNKARPSHHISSHRKIKHMQPKHKLRTECELFSCMHSEISTPDVHFISSDIEIFIIVIPIGRVVIEDSKRLLLIDVGGAYAADGSSRESLLCMMLAQGHTSLQSDLYGSQQGEESMRRNTSLTNTDIHHNNIKDSVNRLPYYKSVMVRPCYLLDSRRQG